MKGCSVSSRIPNQDSWCLQNLQSQKRVEASPKYCVVVVLTITHKLMSRPPNERFTRKSVGLFDVSKC